MVNCATIGPEGPQVYTAEVSHYQRAIPITLAVCGDPVIGKALGLLLQGYRYNAKYLPESSLNEPDTLEGIRLLLLTPQSNAELRASLFALLIDIPGSVEMPILELVTSFERMPEGRLQAWPEGVVAWPCSTQELSRRIEAALCQALRMPETSPEVQ